MRITIYNIYNVYGTHNVLAYILIFSIFIIQIIPSNLSYEMWLNYEGWNQIKFRNTTFILNEFGFCVRIEILFRIARAIWIIIIKPRIKTSPRLFNEDKNKTIGLALYYNILRITISQKQLLFFSWFSNLCSLKSIKVKLTFPINSWVLVHLLLLPTPVAKI